MLLPLTLGIGLYDKDDELVDDYYSGSEYKRDDSGFEMEHTFTSLIRHKPYTAHPLIKYAGGTIVATPSMEFRLDVVVETGEASSVTANSAVLAGHAEGLEAAESLCELGICYATSGTPSIDNGRFVSSGRKKSGDFTVSLSDLEANTTYYYSTCLAIDGEYFYGETKSFKTKGADLCNDAVDLGLSVKWACCNVGATVPEGYGGYYAWGETEEKGNYTRENYKYFNSSTFEYNNIGSNISGTSYDVVHVKWGGSWRMPTLDEIEELCIRCSWEWTTVNGVSGQKVTGRNGNSIFLPAAGYRSGTEVYNRGSRGYYWSGTLYERDSSSASNLLFRSGYPSCGLNYFRGYGHTVRPVTE